MTGSLPIPISRAHLKCPPLAGLPAAHCHEPAGDTTGGCKTHCSSLGLSFLPCLCLPVGHSLTACRCCLQAGPAGSTTFRLMQNACHLQACSLQGPCREEPRQSSGITSHTSFCGPYSSLPAWMGHSSADTCRPEAEHCCPSCTVLPTLHTKCHGTSACRKETHCEFCDSVLPDWKITLTPPCGADAPAVMNVNFDGEGQVCLAAKFCGGWNRGGLQSGSSA